MLGHNKLLVNLGVVVTSHAVSENVRNVVTHIHQVVETLVQSLYSSDVAVGLNTNVELCLGRMRDGVTAEFHIRAAS